MLSQKGTISKSLALHSHAMYLRVNNASPAKTESSILGERYLCSDMPIIFRNYVAPFVSSSKEMLYTARGLRSLTGRVISERYIK